MFIRVRSLKPDLDPLMDQQSIPKLLEGHKSETFKYCAMSIDCDLHTSTTQIKGHGGKQCYVIASDDFQLLCQGFLLADVYSSDKLRQSKFRVTVHRNLEGALSDEPAPSSPQRRLLDPLTVLHSAPNFEFAGYVNMKYCANIAARVSRTAPSIEECLVEVIQLMDKGQGDIARNHLRSAVDVYKMAYIQLVYFCIPRRANRHSWVAQHPEQQLTVRDIRFTLRANLAFVHYTLEEFEDAHLWAWHACDAHPSFSKDKLRWKTLHAKLVYLQVLASTRLGKDQQGVDELCSGLKDARHEVYKDKELVQWRMQARAQIKGRDEGDNVRLLRAMGIEGHDRND